MTLSPICADDTRRALLRRSENLNGLDGVEIGEDPRTLRLFFIRPPPADLTPADIVIEGGERVTGIRATAVALEPAEDADSESVVSVTIDRIGDFSPYRLRLVGLDGIDPRYADAEFRFHLGRTSGIDCAPAAAAAPEPGNTPDIDYLARDYTSLRQLMLDRMSRTVPDWQERHVPDLGITLVEILAYVGDYLSYCQDAVATEAYLRTARKRVSVRRHARLVDYAMHEGCNARAWICITATKDETVDPATLSFATLPDDGGTAMRFAPMQTQPIALRTARNKIALHAWGNRNCWLPRGATAVTLRDPDRSLADQITAGDVLLLEEVADPTTGRATDADTAHRHAVRLVSAAAGYDALLDLHTVDVTWAAEDALPFRLCLAAEITPGASAAISVARGNVVPADHGITVHETLPPDLGRPPLSQAPVTFSEPPPLTGPAALMNMRDPRRALPLIAITGELDGKTSRWRVRRDLLASLPIDQDFVLEVEDEGARIRFGNGELGLAPAPGMVFTATYRVGNGPAGNVGADSIVQVLRDAAPDASLAARNPLPASGGVAAESLDAVRALAPQAYRNELRRAITEADYAALAGDNPLVQRAAASLSWTGSRHIVRVTLDPLGSETLDSALARQVAAKLHEVRRVGHEIEVGPARYVALDLALEVEVDASYRRGEVAAALAARFGTGILPDGSQGFFHPDQLTFGEPIYVSRIIAAAQALAGISAVGASRLERMFAGPDGELEQGFLAIGADEVARLDNDRSLPGHGRLTLRLRGGR